MFKISSRKWKESKIQRLKILEQLRVEDQFCDVTLQCQDEMTVKAHKIILIMASEYFKVLFSSGMKESFKNCVKYEFINANILEKVISFIYTREMSIASAEEIEEIIMCANYFLLTDLVNECVDLLSNLINDNNCLYYWRKAQKYVHQKLEYLCIYHILNSPRGTYENESFFFELNKYEVKELLKNYRLMWFESEKFEKIIQWTRRNTKATEEFNEVFLNLIEHVNFSRIGNIISRIVLKYDFLRIEHQNILNIIADKYEWPGPLFAASASRKKLLAFISNKFSPYYRKIYKSISDEGEFTTLCRDSDNIFWTTCCCAAFNNCLFICGEQYAEEGGRTIYPNMCEYFDPLEKKCHPLPAMKIERISHSCSFLEDKIYACGGFNRNNGLNVVEVFDINQQKWTNGPNMNAKRYSFSLAASNRALYAVGCSDIIEMFDPRSRDGWMNIDIHIEKAYYIYCVAIDSEIFCFYATMPSVVVFDTKINKIRNWEGTENYEKETNFNLIKICEVDGFLTSIHRNEENSKFIDIHKYDKKGNFLFSKLQAYQKREFDIIQSLVSLNY